MKLINSTEKFKKFTKIVRQNPNNYEARIDLGILNIQINKISDAKKNFEKAIEIDQYRDEAYLNLSNLYVLQKNISESINILKKFIQSNQYNKNIITNLATIYFNFNKTEDLEKFLYKYLNTEDNHVLFYIKANLLLRKDKTNQAINFFFKSINNNKTFWSAYEELIVLLEKTNQLTNLKKYINLAKINFSDEIKIIYFDALYLYRLKKYSLSLKILTENDLVKKFNQDPYLVNILDLLI